MTQQQFTNKPGDSGADTPVTGEQLVRQEAIRQIGRRRQFWFWAVMGTLFMILLTVAWAFSQYHYAGGWPTNGFSQSDSGWGYPNVWNPWIIWPAIVWVLATAGYAWFVYGNKPVSENKIKREMKRQAAQRR